MWLYSHAFRCLTRHFCWTNEYAHTYFYFFWIKSGSSFSPEVRSEAPFTFVGMEIIAITKKKERKIAREWEKWAKKMWPAQYNHNVFVGLSYRQNNTLILHLKNGKKEMRIRKIRGKNALSETDTESESKRKIRRHRATLRWAMHIMCAAVQYSENEYIRVLNLITFTN